MEPRSGKTRTCVLFSLLICSIILRQSNLAYSFMSISSKIVSLAVTYPYQVVRSRVQVSKY